MDQGHALLVGVGGSGRQSLARLAAFAAGCEVFEITLNRGYGEEEFREDLKQLYHKLGLENKKVTRLAILLNTVYHQLLFYTLSTDGVLIHRWPRGSRRYSSLLFFRNYSQLLLTSLSSSFVGFLELINNMLTSGMVPALFADDEKEAVIGQVGD